MDTQLDQMHIDTPDARPNIDDATAVGTALGSLARLLSKRSPPDAYIACRESNPFHLKHAPPMPLSEFMARLQKYFACSSMSFVVAAVLLRRLHVVVPQFFSEKSTHKLILAALTIAAKFTDDASCKQSHYARCGGVEVAELNILETTFLNSVSYGVFVDEAEYDECCALLLHLDANPVSASRHALGGVDVHAYKRHTAPHTTAPMAIARGSC